ncbi:MAG: hypothetical protein E6G67_03340 [Actinobacteria bacterium]|nr:MAG: hypothetical protein E6G67_03340 [Actinomycetota bacterium]
MKPIVRFGRFWWDFLVGDDWRIAIGVAALLGLTALPVSAGIAAWWLLPVGVMVVLADSLRRAARSSRQS